VISIKEIRNAGERKTFLETRKKGGATGKEGTFAILEDTTVRLAP